MSTLTGMPSLDKPSNNKPLIGSVYERTPTRFTSPLKLFSSGTASTGFPTVKHRSQIEGSGAVRGKSAFLRSREDHKKTISSDSAVKIRQVPTVTSTEQYGEKVLEDSDWRQAISQENESRVDAMTEEEREQEKREIVERFGDGIGELLRKVREARLKKPAQDKVDLDEVPFSAESPKNQPLQLSPPRPSLSSADNSRPSTPTRSARKLRFAELTPTDVHVYESAPSSPRRKALLALPPPPLDGGTDIVSLGSLSPPSTGTKEDSEPPEGTPEYIRRRFFPSAPADNPDLAWMVDPPSSSSTQENNPVRFDLSGNLVPPSLSLQLPTHLGLHHHAEGKRAGYTLDDIFLLVRSRSGAQRAAMLGILVGVVRLLRKCKHGVAVNIADEMKPSLYALQSQAPAVLKQILFAGLEALNERGSVGARSVEVLWECIVGWEMGDDTGDVPDHVEMDDVNWRYGGVEMCDSSPQSPSSDTQSEDSPPQVAQFVSLISALPLNLLLPQIAKVLISPPDFELAPSLGQTPTQQSLLSILHHLSEHANLISEEIAKTPGLLASIVDIFVIPSGNSGVSRTDPNALHFLISLVTASRVSAKAVIDMGIPNALLRFLVSVEDLESFEPSPGDSISRSVDILHKTIKIFVTLGRYGMCASIASDAMEVWRRVEAFIGKIASSSVDRGDFPLISVDQKVNLVETWACLLEVWIVCATDPHRTTPSHDILWSQVSAWAWSEDLVGLTFALKAGLLQGVEDNNTLAVKVQPMVAALWRALAAWLEGSRVNGARGGDKERKESLEVLRPGFETGMEGKYLRAVVDDLKKALACLNTHTGSPSLLLASIKAAASHAHTLVASIRLWLACLPPPSEGPLSSPPYTLPFATISELCADLVSHPLWSLLSSFSRGNPDHYRIYAYMRVLIRPLTTLLFFYLQLSKRLPGASRELWVAQVFCILLRMQPGDEEYALDLLTRLIKTISPKWASAHGIRAPNEVWEKGGVGIIKLFLVDLFTGRSTGMDVDDQVYLTSPLMPSPQSVLEARSLRISAPKASDLAGSHGLPLRKDWMLSPLDHLLKLSTASSSGREKEILIASPWAATETDIVRATLLFARVSQIVMGQLKSGDGRLEEVVTMTSDEVVFNCMKVFMLEHELAEDETPGGEEVFRDGAVSSLMQDLLRPYTFSVTSASLSTPPREDLEAVAATYLGSAIPFYQFYTDFVALYDSISFSHPIFALLLLPPLSMHYPGDYRKHLWNDFGHVIKTIRTPIDHVVTTDLAVYLWPIEQDTQIISAYLRALLRHGSALEGFVRFVAVHHVASNIWYNKGSLSSAPSYGEKAGKLLTAIVNQGGMEIVRDIVRYRQVPDAESLLVPPRCFEDEMDDEWRIRRLNAIDTLGGSALQAQLRGLLGQVR